MMAKMEKSNFGGQLDVHLPAVMNESHNARRSSSLSQIEISRSYSGSPENGYQMEHRGLVGDSLYCRKESKASVSQIQLQETYISVEALEGRKEVQENTSWKRNRRRTKRFSEMKEYMQSATITRITHPLEENIIVSILAGTLNVFLIMIISIPITILLLISLPLVLFLKYISIACSKDFYCDLSFMGSNYLSPHDAQYFLYENQLAMHSILFIDGSVDLLRIRQIMSNRVINAKTGSGTYMYPRLTQLVAHMPNGLVWHIDNKFNLNNHIFLGPEITTEQNLQAYISSLLTQPLKLSRPLWEVIVLTSYGSHKDTILICRLHHCIADGISLLRVLCQSLSDNQIMHIPQKPHFGGTTYGLNLFKSFLIGPLTVLTWLCWCKQDRNFLTRCKKKSFVKTKVIISNANEVDQSQGRNSQSEPSCQTIFTGKESDCLKHKIDFKENGILTMIDKRNNLGFAVVWSSSIPMNKVMRIKQITRTCVNDVILSTLSGALRNTLQKLGVLNPPTMKVNLTVDLRSSAVPFSIPKLGTKGASVSLTLPVDVEGAIPRVWKIRETLEEMKASAEAVVSYCLVWWAYKCLPLSWCSTLVKEITSKSSIQYSSLPGPLSPIILGGYGVKKIFNISPPLDSVNLSVTVITYLDKVSVTVCARNSIPRAHWIANNIISEMNTQCDQMNKILSYRRLPQDPNKFNFNYASGLHARRPLPELQLTLARVQSELQKVTEQYELEYRRGLYKKSISSDFELYQKSSIHYESEGRHVASFGKAKQTTKGDRKENKYRRASASSVSFNSSGQDLALKVQSLKQEFTDLLTEIRRRKSISEGVCSSSTEVNEGDLRKPRKRTLSLVPARPASTSFREISSKEFYLQ